MNVHPLSERRQAVESSWQQPGCGLLCREHRFILPGVMRPVGVPIHDPASHEEYGRYLASLSVAPTVSPVIRTGGLAVDTQCMAVLLDGRVARLTPLETSLLVYLATRIGMLCRTHEIARAVWGDDYCSASDRHDSKTLEVRNLRMVVFRLRAKIDRERALIVTHAGFGYRLLAVTPVEAGNDA